MLRPDRRWNGRTIGVGLPWDGGVFIQEYWSRGAPGYAVASSADQAVTLSLAEWTGEVGRVVLGPWQLEGRSTRCFDASPLLTPRSGALLAVVRDGGSFLGLLRAPQPAVPPPGTGAKIVTVEGLNGLGDRNAGLCCVQPELSFRPAGVVSLRFYAPGDTGILHWGAPQPPSGFPLAIVQQVRSDTLSVEVVGSTFVVGANRPRERPRHRIVTTVRLPESPYPTMAALVAHVRTAAGAGFTFARGLLVQAQEA
jgi:hypothetical protein